jgi:hypothetical protein
MRVAKLAGRGVYSPAEMETWIGKALDYGIYGIDVWSSSACRNRTKNPSMDPSTIVIDC